MIYLASPYWHVSEEVRNQRVNNLTAFHAHLVAQPTRSFYFNPLVNSLGCVAPEEYWLAHGLHMLKSAQAMYVLCQDGWQESKGLKKEVATCHAERVTIHYFDPATFKELHL